MGPGGRVIVRGRGTVRGPGLCLWDGVIVRRTGHMREARPHEEGKDIVRGNGHQEGLQDIMSRRRHPEGDRTS